MAFLENLFRSDFTILLAVIFCVYHVFLAVWGLGMMNNNCLNRTLFTNLRICLVSSAVMATILICIGTCNVACNTDLNLGFLAICLFIWGVMNLASGIYIASNIADCTSNDVSIYKDCWYVAYVVQIAVVISCIYYAFMRYSKRTVAKAKERTRTVEKQRADLEQLRKEEERATALAKKELELAERQKEERDKITLLQQEREEARKRTVELKRPPKRDKLSDDIEQAARELKRNALLNNKQRVADLERKIDQKLPDANDADRLQLLQVKQKLRQINRTELENPSFDIDRYNPFAKKPRRFGGYQDEDTGWPRLFGAE